MSKRAFLITGANSGLGFECSLALAKQGNTHVILAGRSKQRIDEAVAKAEAAKAASSVVEGAIVDLASLKSVRQLAREMIQRGLQFTTIVCNAGLQLTLKAYTEEGFETTVGVNHTAHFLLLKLLKDHTQRILVVGSETHDPTQTPGIGPIDMSNIDALAKGVEPYDGNKVYATSKLCNTIFTKEFARRYPDGPEILVYAPGFTPDTAIFRERNFLVRVLIKYIVGFVVWMSGGRNSTPEYSGGFMARIASAESWEKEGWKSGDYIRVDEICEASAQSREEKLGKELWDKTEEWVKPFAN